MMAYAMDMLKIKVKAGPKDIKALLLKVTTKTKLVRNIKLKEPIRPNITNLVWSLLFPCECLCFLSRLKIPPPKHEITNIEKKTIPGFGTGFWFSSWSKISGVCDNIMTNNVYNDATFLIEAFPLRLRSGKVVNVKKTDRHSNEAKAITMRTQIIWSNKTGFTEK
jgi:hypothetical protein